MDLLRTEIARALNELIDSEAGTRFQALAVVLAKQKWPELIAFEWHNDGGLDAYASASLAEDGRAKGLACSITGTLKKIRSDAETAKKNYPDLEILIFATPCKITGSTVKRWAKNIRDEFGLELVVISREEVIASLTIPSNAPLCATLPGVRVPIAQDAAALHAKVREAVAEEAQNWRAKQRLADRPIISLNAVRLDAAAKETSDTLDPSALYMALAESRRIALEAPGGGGKTTTLVQLATESQPEGQITFLIDLPAWIRSGTDVLEFIARARPFRARDIKVGDLARLAERAHFSFLLNGWNEIAEVHSADAVIALRELERDFPAAGIMVATRTHYITPPLPGAFRVRLLRFNRGQRADYLRQTLRDRADELRLQLEGNSILDALTRTPLILAEVVTIFQSGAPIPTTRIGVLAAVMNLIETSDEHRHRLQDAPLFNDAQRYLERLACQMTIRGEVEIAEPAARQVILSVSAELLAERQIAAAPDPATILHTLTAHHVLEQLDYHSSAFRFQHQQFQEYYAARFLASALAQLLERDDDAANRTFAASYINWPMWEEPLRMIAEDIHERSEDLTGKTAAVAAGARLVNLALDVDPTLAGDLSRLCGSAVWSAVRGRVGGVLRRWYALDETSDRQCALAAMLATGSSDFADILIPRLADRDRDVRISAYEAGNAFYPSSLGVDWRHVVDGWDEEARADFVSEVTHRGLMADITESFAMNDPSTEVRKQAIQALCWMGATDALTRVVDALDDSGLETVLPAFFSETIPVLLRPRFAAANRRLVAQETTPLARIRRLLHSAEFGDFAITQDLITELEALRPPLDQGAGHAVAAAIKIVRKHDQPWASAWVTAKLRDGMLSSDDWRSYLLPVSEPQSTDLIDRLATRELGYQESSAIRMILSVSATPALAAQLLEKLRELHRAISATPADQLARKCWGQLHDVLRAIPANAVAEGLMQLRGGEFDADIFEVVVDLLGAVAADADDLRSEMSAPSRQSLRHYVKRGITKILADDLFDDSTRANAAIAVARIGDAEDLADLRRLIDADIHRSGRVTYANWYVQALLWLDVADAETALIDLLCEQKYENEAARGLVQLAVPAIRESPLRGDAADYDAIWAARAGMPRRGFDTARAKRYAAAIRVRISELQEERAGDTRTENYIFRMKNLAVLLAALDGHDSADTVIDILLLPAEWDGYIRMTGIKTLLMSGATLKLESIFAVLDPAIERAMSQGYDDNRLSLLLNCLKLLPFSDDPARAIARIEQVLARFRYPPFQLRDLVRAIGYTRSDAAVPFLLNIARRGNGLQHMEDTWIEALDRLHTSDAQDVLLSFVDPRIPTPGIDITFDYRNTEVFASYVSRWAQEDPALKQRLISLSGASLTPLQRQLLGSVYRGLGDDETMLAAANLFQGAIEFPGSARDLEDIVLERRPHGNAGSFTFVPRDAQQFRTKLFQTILDDPSRRNAAFATLTQVEVLRIEHGRPPGEPRHPMIDSCEPWPPLSLIEENRSNT